MTNGAKAVEAALRATVLPAGLRFDGIMNLRGYGLVQFTEVDQSAESYGATFYVELKGFSLDKAIAGREEKRLEFKAPQRVAA